MTINRSALRRNTATALLAKIKTSTEKKERQEDTRMWQPSVDANGNGFAVLRFLPAKNEDSLPYIKQYSQGFDVNGKWFINLCPTTINLPSPAVEHCNELWETGLESDKTIARKRKRKLNYFANVLIIKDPKNPANEGKVMIYKFGQKVFEKLMAVMNPPEEFGEDPRDPFGFFDGCVVKLKIRKKDGYRNFDESTVEKAEDLFGGDEDKLMEILEQCHDLDELNDPKHFKDYEKLKTELYRVIGDQRGSDDSPVQQRHEERQSPARSTNYNESRRSEPEPSRETAPVQASGSTPDDEDDDLAMFQAMAADD